MKKNLKKIIALVIIVSYFGFCMPRLTHAQVPFGGLDVSDNYNLCDCSGTVYSLFEPLYLGGAPVIGSLTWYSGSFQYPNYTLHPGAWALGYIIPGWPMCWKVYGYVCIPVPAIGHITPFTGTSL